MSELVIESDPVFDLLLKSCRTRLGTDDVTCVTITSEKLDSNHPFAVIWTMLLSVGEPRGYEVDDIRCGTHKAFGRLRNQAGHSADLDLCAAWVKNPDESRSYAVLAARVSDVRREFKVDDMGALMIESMF